MTGEGRRSFLRQLATLPLIGGSVAIIGQPSAAAEPITADLLEAYKSFLHFESRFLAWEMAGRPDCLSRYRFNEEETRTERGQHIRKSIFVGGTGNATRVPTETAPSSRAALIMSAAGVDWRT